MCVCVFVEGGLLLHGVCVCLYEMDLFRSFHMVPQAAYEAVFTRSLWDFQRLKRDGKMELVSRDWQKMIGERDKVSEKNIEKQKKCVVYTFSWLDLPSSWHNTLPRGLDWTAVLIRSLTFLLEMSNSCTFMPLPLKFYMKSGCWPSLVELATLMGVNRVPDVQRKTKNNSYIGK